MLSNLAFKYSTIDLVSSSPLEGMGNLNYTQSNSCKHSKSITFLGTKTKCYNLFVLSLNILLYIILILIILINSTYLASLLSYGVGMAMCCMGVYLFLMASICCCSMASLIGKLPVIPDIPIPPKSVNLSG